MNLNFKELTVFLAFPALYKIIWIYVLLFMRSGVPMESHHREHVCWIHVCPRQQRKGKFSNHLHRGGIRTFTDWSGEVHSFVLVYKFIFSVLPAPNINYTNINNFTH